MSNNLDVPEKLNVGDYICEHKNRHGREYMEVAQVVRITKTQAVCTGRNNREVRIKNMAVVTRSYGSEVEKQTFREIGNTHSQWERYTGERKALHKKIKLHNAAKTFLLSYAVKLPIDNQVELFKFAASRGFVDYFKKEK